MKGVVAAAMSGGVDSAVTAALLKQEGYDVIGITLQIWQEHSDSGKYGGCCSLGAVEDARRAAAKIGIPHYVLNFREYFAEKVIDNFVSEYAKGRTPNPCVECNRSVKFEELLRQASNLGADYLATGHYARIRFNDKSGRHELLKARDAGKDQSYALYTLDQAALSRTLMPLGNLAGKHETRRIATELGLALANKPDSQEICFVPKAGYVSFLEKKAPDILTPGPIVDMTGKEVGTHEGIALYTIGQRKRLPGGSIRPMVVVRLVAQTNTVVIGYEEDLLETDFVAVNCTWSAIEGIAGAAEVLCKIRYNGTAATAVIRSTDQPSRVTGRFYEPQRAITPGQSAVFYGGTGDERGQVVLGGGTLDDIRPFSTNNSANKELVGLS